MIKIERKVEVRASERKNQTNWNVRKRTKIGHILLANKGHRFKEDKIHVATMNGCSL